MTARHLPVMVDAVTRLLRARPGARIVDATVGLGGHAERILRELGPEGQLIGVDRDTDMLRQTRERLRPFGGAVQLVHTRLSHLYEAVRASGVDRVDGILMDLGLCSAQLDDEGRGFSFRSEATPAPLDMRMDRERGETARELLERLDEAGLAEVLRTGGVPPRAAWPERCSHTGPSRPPGPFWTCCATFRCPGVGTIPPPSSSRRCASP